MFKGRLRLKVSSRAAGATQKNPVSKKKKKKKRVSLWHFRILQIKGTILNGVNLRLISPALGISE